MRLDAIDDGVGGLGESPVGHLLLPQGLRQSGGQSYAAILDRTHQKVWAWVN